MKGNKSTVKSVMIIMLALVLVSSVLVPMSANADTTGNYYTVKSGDSLSKIAASYGVTVSEIVALNNISASSIIYPGQVLLMPKGSVQSGSSYTQKEYGNISVNFNEVNVLSALSAVTKFTDYTILYLGAEQTVTANISNVTPLTAVDYLLRMVNMSYIKNGNMLIVGDVGMLNSNFIDKATLVKFNLKYITTEILTSQLGVLGVGVNFIEVGDTNRECWVNAYPMQLATIRELVSLLDKKSNLSLGSANIANYFNYIELEYMPASDFSSLLSQLGLHAGITIENFPMRLFVYATGDALKDIMKIKALVDIRTQEDNTSPSDGNTNPTGEDVEISDGIDVLKRLTLSCIEKSDVEGIVSTFMLDVEVLGVDLLAKTVWLLGTQEEVDKAVTMISSFDVESLKTSNTFFTYELQNITADQLEYKLGFITFDGQVQFDYGNFPQISHTVTIFCPEDQRQSILDVIAKLDTNSTKLYKTLKSATSQTEKDNILNKIDLICEITGLSADAFYFTEDLDSSADSEEYVLYAYESPENIQLIQTMFTELGL
ncbi:MAG: LysM peptidoglycan-binding domain-containing protein [Acutalibacteraceae bacterium]